MVSVRLFFAPWWVRLLAVAAPMAALAVAVYLLGFPGATRAMGWLWGLLWAALVGLGAAGLRMAVAAPARRAVLDAVSGLDPGRRQQAVRALAGGPVPEDRDVAAAALRLDALTDAYRRELPPWVRTQRWWVSGVAGVMAAVEFASRAPRLGRVFVALAVLAAGLALRDRWLRRRRHERLPLLRAALGETAGGAPAAGAEAARVPRPRLRLALAGALLFAIVFAAPVFLARPRPDCETADALVTYLYDHQRLLDHRLVGPGGPPLSEYRGWANQLRSYRDQVSAADVAARVRDIAALADRAVAQVSDAYAVGDANAADDIARRQAAYQSVAAQIAEADNALLAACHPRR